VQHLSHLHFPFVHSHLSHLHLSHLQPLTAGQHLCAITAPAVSVKQQPKNDANTILKKHFIDFSFLELLYLEYEKAKYNQQKAQKAIR